MPKNTSKIIMLIVGQLFLASMFLAITGENNNLVIRSLHIPDTFFKYIIYFGQVNWLFVLTSLTLFVLLFWLVIVPYWINGWIRKHK